MDKQHLPGTQMTSDIASDHRIYPNNRASDDAFALCCLISYSPILGRGYYLST